MKKIILGLSIVLMVVLLVALTPLFLTKFGSKLLSGTDELYILTSEEIPENTSTLYIAYTGSNQLQPQLFAIDGSEQVKVSGGYGQYKLASVVPLLQMEGKSEQETAAALARALGLPVSRIITLKEQIPQPATKSELVSVLYKSLFKQLTHFAIPREELLFLEAVRQAPILEVLPLNESQKAISRLLDLTAQVQQFSLCSVAIVNTTGEPGQARQLANMLERRGGRVVRITDTQVQSEQTILHYHAEASSCQSIISVVKTWFSKPLEISENSLETEKYRSQLVIFIGMDSI
ncbi:MAG: hypothetical protein COY80_03925 [Candidatus Pacebacteria bacterium CG_4_10_14_0_8_um_filter_42_14]|nr:MAG: hypothetical protein COY80_03925 [Candidatus Pacebacteria bacterium CG_4_10_14_0_8_um_filter_42_14]